MKIGDKLLNKHEVLIRFQKTKRIGREGYNSMVYKAKDLQLNTDIAIKQIPLEYFENNSTYFDEAKLQQMSGHSHIVPVKYAGRDSEFVYIAMPFYSSGSLSQMLNNKNLTSRKVLSIAFDFLLGINYLHLHNIIHLDIKPANILIANSGRALISDFGLAKNLRIPQNRLDNYYAVQMPPEIYQKDQNLGFSTDIFQIGMTLYRMVNGNRVLKNQFRKYVSDEHGNYSKESLIQAISEGKYPERQTYLPHVPRKLRRIINKCIEPNPENRYQTIQLLLNDLARVTEQPDIVYSYSLGQEISQKWTIEQKKESHVFEIVHQEKSCSLCSYKVDLKTKTKQIITNTDFNLSNASIKTAYAKLEKIFTQFY